MIKVKLREIMWEKDISGVELSKMTGISSAVISRIVRGKQSNLRLHTIDKLCTALYCRIEDLLEFERENK